MYLIEEMVKVFGELRADFSNAELRLKDLIISEQAKHSEAVRSQMDAARQAEVCQADASAARDALLAAEARVDKLEDKLEQKRDEANKLDAQVTRYSGKLAQTKAAFKELKAHCDLLEEQLKLVRGGGKDSDDEAAFSKGHSGHDRGVVAEVNGEAAKLEGRSPSRSLRRGSRLRSQPRSASHGSCSSSQGHRKVEYHQERGRDREPQDEDLDRQRKERRDRERSGSVRKVRDESRGRRSRSRSVRLSRNRSRSRMVRRGKGAPKGGQRRPEPAARDGSALLCFLYCIDKCKKGDACPSRHPGGKEVRLIRERMETTSCRFGLECSREDCVFKHPEGIRAWERETQSQPARADRGDNRGDRGDRGDRDRDRDRRS